MILEVVTFLGWIYWSLEDWSKQTINAYISPILIVSTLPFIQTKVFLVSVLFYLPAIALTTTSMFKTGDTIILVTLLFTSQLVNPVQTLFNASLLLSVLLILYRLDIIQQEKLWFAPVAAISHLTPYLV